MYLENFSNLLRKTSKSLFLLGLFSLTFDTVLLFIEKDECSPNPCKNNGSCLPNVIEDESRELEMSDPSGASFVCVCPPGYTGRLCETGKSTF